jgi:uncharacterized protein (TIGR02246 family)
MRSTLATVILIAALLQPWFCSVALAQESPTAAVDSAAIRQLITEFYASFSRHDAHAATMTFTEDGDFTNMAGIHVHGHQAIEGRFASLFAGNLRAAQRTDTVRSIRFLTPTLALVDADTIITGTRAPDGSEGPPRKGLMIVVVTNEGGHWLISNFHEAEFPQPRSGR